MFVHKVETTFMRKRKPADYEGVDCSVTLGATLDEGDDYTQVVRRLADEAAIVVYARIGMREAAKPVFSAEVVVTTSDGEVGKTAVAVHPPKAESVVAEKRTPGRPKKLDVPTPAATTNISASPENRRDPATSDIPEELKPTKAASTDIPEDAKSAPAAGNGAAKADIPEDSAPVAVTYAQLHQFVIDSVGKGSSPLTADAVKRIFMETTGVGQMGKMDEAQRAKALAGVQAAVRAKAEMSALS